MSQFAETVSKVGYAGGNRNDWVY